MTAYTRYPRATLWLVPGASAELPSFYLAKTPITNLQFEAFDAEYRRSAASRGDGDAAVGITFDRAVAYCDWYARLSRKPIRLPTEREWEYAFRGAGEREPASFGLLGMGDMWEWTSSPVLRRGVEDRLPAKPSTVRDDVGFRILREFPG